MAKELLLKVFVDSGDKLSFELYGDRDSIISTLPMYTDMVRREILESFLEDCEFVSSRPVARVLTNSALKKLIRAGLVYHKHHPDTYKKAVIDLNK